jgi:hypothetical protein
MFCLIPRMHATCSSRLFISGLIILITFGEAYNSTVSNLTFANAPAVFALVRSTNWRCVLQSHFCLVIACVRAICRREPRRRRETGVLQVTLPASLFICCQRMNCKRQRAHSPPATSS